MICLDNTDTLEGGASVDAVVDYTVHGLVGTTFTNLAQGQLSDTDPSILYTAGAAISVVSVIFVNTHSATVTVNLYLDPANAGTPRRLIPKTLSLPVGYSMHFDGAKISILNTNGCIITGIDVSDVAYNATSWNGVTTIAPSKNAIRDYIEEKADAAFLVQATGQVNIAKDEEVTVLFDTEIKDPGGNFASNTFTAPSTGLYQLNVILYLLQVPIDAVYVRVTLKTSNRSYYWVIDPNYSANLNYFTISIAVLADMDAADTAYVTIFQSGGTVQLGIESASYFSGFLAA